MSSTARKIIAAAALSRSAFETIAATIDKEEFGALYVPVWEAVREYYGRDADAKSADTEILTDRVAGAGAGDKRQKALRSMCEEVWAEDVSPANVADYVRDHAIEGAGMRLASAVAGRRSRDEIEPIARAYIELLDMPDTQDTEAEEVSWAQVLRKRLDPRERIKVSPKCLNERLGGGVFPGTNITIAGRPEVGKSAFALTMACGFARRGLRGLYLTNEDAAAVLMLRVACNLTNLTEQELADNPEAERLALAKGAANVKVIDICPGTPGEIEAIVKHHKPAWVVVDQLRNMRVKGAGSNTERLDQAAQSIRTLGKKYNLVTISLAQAEASSTGKLVLEQEDIDSSKTGIPGAADLIVMIGMNEELRLASQRMLNTPKNKVTSRHEHWQVAIDPFRSKYRSL